MHVLKDVRCRACEWLVEAMLEPDVTSVVALCPRCQREQPLDSWCTGGQKLKTYCHSYDGRDWSGDIEHLGVAPGGITYWHNGEPVVERDGTPTEQKLIARNAERIGARRERIRSEYRRKRGGSPAFVGTNRSKASGSANGS